MTDPLAPLASEGARAAAAVVGPGGIVASLGDLDDRFWLASVTKLLSAYALLVATEEGVTSLDEPAGPPGATLAHLLAHASGLSYGRRDNVVAAPGTRRIYSNAGFEVAADHLAAAADLGFGEYLSAGVFEPLGMTRTTLEGSPAHGAFSSVHDLAAFAAELFAPVLIAPETLLGATTVAFGGIAGVLPGFGAMDPLDWGLGFELRDSKRPHWTGRSNDPRTFGHFGQSGTCLWVDPARLGLIALVDKPFGSWAARLWPEVSDAVLSAFGDGAPPPSTLADVVDGKVAR